MHKAMLLKHKSLIYGFSHVRDGSMKLPGASADAGVMRNRKRFFTKLDINLAKIVSAGLVHGAKIAVVNVEHGGKIISGVDGLVTNKKDIYLTITVADCLPVYFYDPKKQIIGLAHCGWKGLAGGLLMKTVSLMKKRFGVNPARLEVLIGPHIKSCHYQIKSDLAKIFGRYREALVSRPGGLFLDLAMIASEELKQSGILPKHITVSGQCTFCDHEFFSYRREKPKKLQAMVAYIGLIQ